MVYVSPYLVLGQVKGKGVQVSLTNLHTKNGTHMFYYHIEPYKHNNYMVVDNHTEI